MKQYRFFTAVLVIAALLTLSSCESDTAEGGQGDFGGQEQQSSSKEEIVFPELTPLASWYEVESFLEANAPTDLAEFYENYNTIMFKRGKLERKVVGDFNCAVDKEYGMAIILSYAGSADFSGELVIPAEIDGCRVIVGYAMDTLPEGVTSLVVEDGVQALMNDCASPNLTSVTLPDSLLVLSGGTFTGCPLTEIDLPDSLYVADACSNTQITEITFPENMIYVNGFGNSSLTSVTFEGDHVLALGEYAFWRCGNLTTIQIPNSVKYIHPQAFLETSVTVPTEKIFNP